MINTTIALTLLLAAAPSSPPNVTPPGFADQLDDAEIVRDGDGVQLIAYDRAGEPIGTHPASRAGRHPLRGVLIWRGAT